MPIILSILLLAIAYQDFRYRAVSWLLLTALCGVLAYGGLVKNHWQQWMLDSLINLTFFLLQYAAITLYFSWRNHRPVNIADTYLGWGDILFILAMCMGFGTVTFLLLYVGGLLTVLLGFLVYRFLHRSASEQIPLAGGLALVLIASQYVVDPTDIFALLL